MAERYDVIVIGTGQAGQAAAAGCARRGLRTAVVDRLPYGGTCALRGCDPKRVLLAGVDAVEGLRRLEGRGTVGPARLQWDALQRFKRTFTDPVPRDVERWLRSIGVTTLHGEARFVAADRLDVEGAECEAASVVVATGAWPAPLGIPGDELVTRSHDFLELFELPARVVFVGGGYVSFELAHMAAAAGSACTIVHRGSRPLEGFDADVVAMLVESSREAGIDIVLDAPVTGVRREAGELVVDAGGRALRCDLAVHGAGRPPDIAGLSLEAADVAHGPRGIEVDEKLRSTTNPGVFACGDAAARGLPLTPVAARQGRIVARVIGGDETAAWDDPVTPTVCFTGPPLASVGMTEQAARASGIDVDVKLSDTSAWYRSRRLAVVRSGAKTIVERTTRRIVGAHLFGPDAEETVNTLAVAISAGMTADQVIARPLAYPTSAMDFDFLF